LSVEQSSERRAHLIDTTARESKQRSSRLTYIEAINDIAQRMIRKLVIMLVGHKSTDAAGKAFSQRQTLRQAGDVANPA